MCTFAVFLSLIHTFIHYIWKTCYVPGTVFYAEDTTANTIDVQSAVVKDKYMLVKEVGHQ